MAGTREHTGRREALLAGALLLLGALLRFAALGAYPPGLNQDEASIGYDAWCLLTSGIDRCGSPWPVLLTSWGSGQNVLYAWLSLPFLAVFGLSTFSVRLCAAFWGSVSLFAFWRLGRRTVGRRFGLLALALLALNPWHLTVSRWALESNLLPACLLLGLWVTDAAEKRPWLLCPAAGIFALGLYAYGTAFLFLPLFLPVIALSLLLRKKAALKHVLAALGVFGLLAFPLALCQLRNALGKPEMRLWWMTLPALTQTRQAATVSFSPAHLGRLLQILWRQSDGLPWNSAGPFGLFWGLPGLCFVLLGLGRLLWLLGKGEGAPMQRRVLLALGAGLVASLFIDVNVNRVNFLFLPLVWCQAEGLWLLGRKLRGALPVCLVLLAVFTVFLGRWYVAEGAEKLGSAFHQGLLEAIAFAESRGGGEIWISGEVNMPYIYALFQSRTPPEEFLATVRYQNPDGAFRRVLSFGRFRFYGEAPPGLCILPVREAGDGELLGIFGGYAVVLR